MNIETSSKAPYAGADVAIEDHPDARTADVEMAARLAIEAVTAASEQQLATVVERAETRIVDALGLVDQQHQEQVQWRARVEQDLTRQLREFGEWDESLRETRNELSGMREMAEAALGVASGDLDRRWDALRRELGDVLATAESDERARWEAFMQGAGETLASNSGIDPQEMTRLRMELTTLGETATQTVTRLQQTQREQLAAMRTELGAVIQQEHERTMAEVKRGLEEAHSTFRTQAASLKQWQETVGKDVAALRESARGAEQQIRGAASELRAEAQTALDLIQSEVDQAVAKSRAGARAEIGEMRSETQQTIVRVHRQSQTWQFVALAMALLAFIISAAALAIPFLHLH